MTALAITPNWKNKTAKFRGTIAAGEHVAVSITNDDGSGNAYVRSTTNLRLNVIDPATGRLLATFPEPVEEGETPATWGNDTTPLTCTLNLNTVQMLAAVRGGMRNFLFVLDDYEAKTLYFKDTCEVEFWPRRIGEEEPVDLDNYQDFVAETEAALAAFGTRLATAEGNAAYARSTADSAARHAAAAQTAAEAAVASVAEIADSKADLVDGKVPSSQLPSYVDDVVEYASLSAFPATGESGKIYVALDTNKIYRWSGSAYIEIANPALDDTVTRTSANGVKSSGIWAAIWGALTALPTGFSSLYDWCAAQLEGKLDKSGGKMTGALDMDGSVVKWRDGNLIYWLSINGLYIWTDGGDTHHSPEWVITFPRKNGVQALLEDIAPDYDQYTSTTYSATDLRVYGDTLYRCTTAHTATTWQSANWTTATVEDILAALRTALAGKADKPATFTDGNLAALDENGNLVDSQIPAANVAVKADLRYSLVAKTMSGGAVTLDDRTCNYVDARALGSPGSLDIDFPALVDGKARDFVLAVECGASPPTISYAAFVTIMAEDASTLTPEEGMNIYSFTEFKTNMFLAARKLVDTVVSNSPESVDQLLLAMQKRGIDTTGITDFGGVAAALGLGDTDTPQDAVDAVMN